MVSAGDAGIEAIQQISIVARYDSVLYPFDILRLLELMPEQGWIVPDLRPERDSSVSFDSPPTKGGVRLRFDQGNKTIGVDGRDLADLLEKFLEVLDAAKGINEDAPLIPLDYCEFRYIGNIRGHMSPVLAFARWTDDNSRSTQFAEAMARKLPARDTALGQYGIRFASKGVDANRPNWTELSLTPVSIYGNSLYHFDLLFRDEEQAVVEDVAGRANDILKTALAELEKS